MRRAHAMYLVYISQKVRLQGTSDRQMLVMAPAEVANFSAAYLETFRNGWNAAPFPCRDV